jgi:hypothetical protein
MCGGWIRGLGQDDVPEPTNVDPLIRTPYRGESAVIVSGGSILERILPQPDTDRASTGHRKGLQREHQVTKEAVRSPFKHPRPTLSRPNPSNTHQWEFHVIFQLGCVHTKGRAKFRPPEHGAHLDLLLDQLVARAWGGISINHISSQSSSSPLFLHPHLLTQDRMSSAGKINYARDVFGIHSVAAAAIFAIFYAFLLPYYLFRAIRNPTYVLIILSLFCASESNPPLCTDVRGY